MKNDREKWIERNLKTHSQNSLEDQQAVTALNYFLTSNEKIVTDFKCNDKWPNVDGTFEFVSDPDLSRRPVQNFFVQIKGTKTDKSADSEKFKYYSLFFYN